MRKNLVVVLMVAVMVGAFAGAGQAALVYADSAYGTGVTNADAVIGASTVDGNYATLDAGGTLFLTLGGYFRDRPTGSDFAIVFSNPQIAEPNLYVSARSIDGTWVNLDSLGGAGSVRGYEISGTGTGYFDLISISTVDYVNGFESFVGKDGGYQVSVPEAGSLLLFGTGMIGLIGYRRVRRMQ